jgi:hypothetical protein
VRVPVLPFRQVSVVVAETDGLPTVIVMVLEVAGFPVRQGVALDVMIQVTWSAVASTEVI